MKRYQVVRKDVRYGKRTFHKGEFLPESFTERDKYRVLYPSRIVVVEVPDPIDVTTPSVSEQKQVVAASKATVNVQPKATVNVQVPKATVPISGAAK